MFLIRLRTSRDLPRSTQTTYCWCQRRVRRACNARYPRASSLSEFPSASAAACAASSERFALRRVALFATWNHEVSKPNQNNFPRHPFYTIANSKCSKNDSALRIRVSRKFSEEYCRRGQGCERELQSRLPRQTRLRHPLALERRPSKSLRRMNRKYWNHWCRRVGGYFGAKLCQLQATKPDLGVNFVARGGHLKAIQADGLIVKAKGDPDLRCRPSFASDRIADLEMLDLCLVCVKQFDLQSILNQLRGVLADHTVIIPLLNGVDSHSKIRQTIKTGYVLPHVSILELTIEKPGVISQSGGACKIFFGPDPDNAKYLRPTFSNFSPTPKSNVSGKPRYNPTYGRSLFLFAAMV